MKDKKPFDILVFESPYEYSDLHAIAFPLERCGLELPPGAKLLPHTIKFQKKFNAIIERMKQLAEVCRKYQIPVRCRTDGDIDEVHSDSTNAVTEDYFIHQYFEGCDYEGSFDMNCLADLGNRKGIKILLSGGYLEYEKPSKGLLNALEKAEVSPKKVENFDLEDRTRRLAVVGGCVAYRAMVLHNHLEALSRKPVIYFDSASAVSMLSTFPKNSVYAFNRVLQADEGATQLVVRRCW